MQGIASASLASVYGSTTLSLRSTATVPTPSVVCLGESLATIARLYIGTEGWKHLTSSMKRIYKPFIIIPNRNRDANTGMTSKK